MAALDPRIYTENFAPDMRFAALVLALPGVAVLAAWRGALGRSLAPADWRLFAFFAMAAVLWLATSANGRYGLVVLLLAGVASRGPSSCCRRGRRASRSLCCSRCRSASASWHRRPAG